MQMEEIPDQEPIVFVDEPADQSVVAYRPATFTAKVDSTPPFTVQWLRDGEPIPDANAFTYTLDVASPNLDGATFSVQVSNLLYSATSSAAVLTVLPDVDAPVLLTATSTNGLTIELTFDERLDPDVAALVDNYIVNGGAIAVVSAELDATGTTIVLTLSERLTDTFDVTVTGVQDMAGNEVLAGSTASGQVQPEVLLIDFGAGSRLTDADPEDVWNNVTEGVGCSDSGKLTGLVTTDGRTTGIDLVMISRFNGANQSGTEDSTLFPADATADSLYGNTESFNSLTDVFPSFQLTGLDPLLTYEITFYASRMGTRDNRETLYTVTGDYPGFAILDPAGNIDGFVALSTIAPTPEGEITISLAPGAANNNGNHFTYLGAMGMQSTPRANGR